MAGDPLPRTRCPPTGCRGRGCLPSCGREGSNVRSGPQPRLYPQAKPGTYLSVLGLLGGQEPRQLSPVLCLQRCCRLGSNKGPVRDAGQRRLLGSDPDQGGARNTSPNVPRAQGLREPLAQIPSPDTAQPLKPATSRQTGMWAVWRARRCPRPLLPPCLWALGTLPLVNTARQGGCRLRPTPACWSPGLSEAPSLTKRKERPLGLAVTHFSLSPGDRPSHQRGREEERRTTS